MLKRTGTERLTSPGPDTHILLVEGAYDFHFMIAFLNAHGLYSKIRCQESEGITNLLAALPIWLKPSNLERLGIIVDADEDVGARWRAVRNILLKADYENIPDVPVSDGMVITHDLRPTVGVWLMPNNTVQGMLEDFAGMLMHDDDKLWGRAVEAVAQIPAEHRLFPSGREMKAKICTWLAWQEEPGMPMGRAITKNLLNVRTPAGLAMERWLRRLFNV